MTEISSDDNLEFHLPDNFSSIFQKSDDLCKRQKISSKKIYEAFTSKALNFRKGKTQIKQMWRNSSISSSWRLHKQKRFIFSFF